MNHQRLQWKQAQRSGVSMIELMATAVVLLSIMTIATGICFQTSLIWKDVKHHRVATAELSNQMDRLTRMPEKDVQKIINSLDPSELSKRTLDSPQLTGSLVQSELGPQINLELNWRRRHPGKPVQLSGWLLKSEMRTP